MALTPDEIAGLQELILSIYGPISEELLQDLCRCIAETGQITSSDEYKLLLAQSLAGADDVIEETLRRQTQLTDDAVKELMQWAASKTVPLEENESLQNIAEAYVKVTRKEVAYVLGNLAAADVDGKVYPIRIYTAGPWTMYSGRYRAERRPPRKLYGAQRFGYGSAVFGRSRDLTAGVFQWSTWRSARSWQKWAK